VSSAPNIRGYVLAGGASSRFGTDKALVELQGKSMLTRTTELLRNVCRDVAIVAPENKLSNSSVETILDRWPGEGPLGGILTALLDAKEKSPANSWSLILSCDMPFLTRDWLAFFAQRALQCASEAVVPQSAHGLEPLCACWKSSAHELISTAFNSGTRKVTDALRKLRMEVLDEKDWKRFDSSGRLFWNMNTFADYEEARRAMTTENS
jgi:molybdopterin-guanine dinucleotide biosynthesis protein A